MKLKRTKGEKITRYETGNYYVDIIEKEDIFESWLTGKGYGISEMMFGSAKEQHHIDGTRYTVDKKAFCDLVEANLPDYILAYSTEYED